VQVALQKRSLIELRELLLRIEQAIQTIEREKRQRAERPPRMVSTYPSRKPARKRTPLLQAPEPAHRSAVPAGDLVEKERTVPDAPAVTASAPTVKFMHPSHRGLFWDGEGSEPAWIAVYLERGGSWAALENTASRLARRR